MPVKVKQSRGDVYLANRDQDLLEGQLFWSYVWNDAKKTNGKKRTYSEGQLWIKDPSSKELTEVANRRSLHAATFRGFIETDFNGDFKNANEETQHFLKHAHIGDFWFFNYKYNKNNESDTFHSFKYTFNKGDALLITKTSYKNTGNETGPYRDILEDVDYIRIPGSLVDTDVSDLKAENLTDAVTELEQRLLYRGEFKNIEEFYKLPKGKGWMYLAREFIRIDKSLLKLPNNAEYTEEKYVLVKRGDFIYWNGLHWTHIRSGVSPKDLPYFPIEKEIDEVVSFDEFHREQLKNVHNVKEALDTLFTQKVGFDEGGRIPYDALPTSLIGAVTNNMILQGLWYPIIDNSLPIDEIKDESNQADWPEPIDTEGNVVDNYKSGWFWIVDTRGVINVPYHDKTQPGRVVELNSGDFIIWVEKTNQFEVIDNSDRVSSIELIINKETGETKQTLLGNVGFKVEDKTGKISTSVKENTIVITVAGLLGQDPDLSGQKNYFPIYKNEKELTKSSLHEEPEADGSTTIISNVGFQVGEEYNPQRTDLYGNITIHSVSTDNSVAGKSNSSYIIDAKALREDSEQFTRVTRISTNLRNRFTSNFTVSEILNILLPDASATLVGIAHDMRISTVKKDEESGEDIEVVETVSDNLTDGYVTKTYKDGFITDTLTSEIFIKDKQLEAEQEEGLLNIGVGRTVSEDVDTGEVTFWAKTKDDQTQGFYIGHHNKELGSIAASRIEHFLNRESKGKTHLTINPTVLKNDIENYIKLPMEDGTLLLWEDWTLHISGQGKPLMIPAWEDMEWDGHKYVGLDTSPITIKLNRKASGNTVVDRVNDLSKDYGTGDKSTWSYIQSNREGLATNDRVSKDDVVSFDSWLEAQRSIATKESFILPASVVQDDDGNVMDPHTLKVTEPEMGPQLVDYGKNAKDGKFQRILPSGTLYRDSEQYFNWHTGKKIPQQVIKKDVEMPSCGGVLLTDRSTIYGGYYAPDIIEKKSG